MTVPVMGCLVAHPALLRPLLAEHLQSATLQLPLVTFPSLGNLTTNVSPSSRASSPLLTHSSPFHCPLFTTTIALEKISILLLTGEEKTRS